jgi:hypothetical protein
VQPFVAANVFGRQRDCEALLYRGVKDARSRLGLRIAG